MTYQSVEIMSEPPGGIAAMRQWIGANYNYHQAAIYNGVRGNLEIKFVVERGDSLTNIQVVRDLGYGTGEEAVRTMQRTRKWSPGIQIGRPVRVRYKMPIRINVLDNKSAEGRESGVPVGSAEEQTADIIDVAPEPPGGMRTFDQWIAQNYRIPSRAIDNGVSGTIPLEFVVEKDGAITDVRILKDPSCEYGTGTG